VPLQRPRDSVTIIRTFVRVVVVVLTFSSGGLAIRCTSGYMDDVISTHIGHDAKKAYIQTDSPGGSTQSLMCRPTSAWLSIDDLADLARLSAQLLTMPQ